MLGAEAFDAGAAPEDPAPACNVAHWRAEPVQELHVESGAAGNWLELEPWQVARRPLAAYAPLARGLVVRGRVEGNGWLALADGAGGRVEVALASGNFELAGDVWSALGPPRFALELGARGEPVRWQALEVLAPWPAPEPAALAAEIEELLAALVDTWLERGLDRDGPRATTFATRYFDVVTGEVVQRSSGQYHPLYAVLLELAPALPAGPRRARYEAALEAHLDDLLELGLHPETGLPRAWDGERDVPLDDLPIEPRAVLEFLLEAADHGPPSRRARALAAAERAARAILAHGVLPDDQVAAKYRPSDARPFFDVKHLRRLDAPALLARVGARTGERACAEAALGAVLELAWLHAWPGTWIEIDPGFDDIFGHFGERALAMLEADPGGEGAPVLRAFVAEGLATYLPLWRQAVRYGGNLAADQVRVWDCAARWAALEPAAAEDVRGALELALFAHLTGEQYPDGSWGDVTIQGFDPKSDLNVGDFTGAPANLLFGLATAADPGLGLDVRAVRALFTGVLRSSRATYGRPFGWLMTRREEAGANLAWQELRCAEGLVRMLETLR